MERLFRFIEALYIGYSLPSISHRCASCLGCLGMAKPRWNGSATGNCKGRAVAVSKAVGLCFELDDFGLVGEAVEEGYDRGYVMEYLVPLRKRLAGGDNSLRPFQKELGAIPILDSMLLAGVD